MKQIPLRGQQRAVVTSRSMDPEDLRYVTRRIAFDTADAPLRGPVTAHPQDRGALLKNLSCGLEKYVLEVNDASSLGATTDMENLL